MRYQHFDTQVEYRIVYVSYKNICKLQQENILCKFYTLLSCKGRPSQHLYVDLKDYIGSQTRHYTDVRISIQYSLTAVKEKRAPGVCWKPFLPARSSRHRHAALTVKEQVKHTGSLLLNRSVVNISPSWHKSKPIYSRRRGGHLVRFIASNFVNFIHTVCRTYEQTGIRKLLRQTSHSRADLSANAEETYKKNSR